MSWWMNVSCGTPPPSARHKRQSHGCWQGACAEAGSGTGHHRSAVGRTLVQGPGPVAAAAQWPLCFARRANGFFLSRFFAQLRVGTGRRRCSCGPYGS